MEKLIAFLAGMGGAGRARRQGLAGSPWYSPRYVILGRFFPEKG